MSAVAPVSYVVSVANLNAHLFQVRLHIRVPKSRQIASLPVWIPGSYLVREFSRHLQNVKASQKGQAVPVKQVSKNTWEFACETESPLDVEYEVYAFDNSVRTAWLDADRGFFNPAVVCLRVHGQETHPHSLCIPTVSYPQDWKLATSLKPLAANERGFEYYMAESYDELADSPVEMGNFWSGEFLAGGVSHRFIVAGATATFDGARLLADARKICEAEMAFWHAEGSKPPHDHYVFLLNAVGSGYGGLEHRYSTALICSRDDLPKIQTAVQADGYNTLLGLISHEYFHTWNVKRMRPVEFEKYDYEQENYTELLWFFEGITSYYDDLLLRRAGLLSVEQYLRVLAKTIHQVVQTPGRQVQSVAQASFDAWVKYYRQEENTVNATVSYYTKGALVALCLDLSLRSEGRTTLDEVMRELWHSSKAEPIGEADILRVLEELGGRSYEQEIADWVHSTKTLPVEQLLEAQGIKLQYAQPNWMQRLGVIATETAGVVLRRVLRGGVAEAAGLAVGDEVLGIEIGEQVWRIKKLEELPRYLPEGQTTFAVMVARDARIIRYLVELAPLDSTRGEVRLLMDPLSENTAQLKSWLG